jgi:hypothetical protein
VFLRNYLRFGREEARRFATEMAKDIRNDWRVSTIAEILDHHINEGCADPACSENFIEHLARELNQVI